MQYCTSNKRPTLIGVALLAPRFTQTIDEIISIWNKHSSSVPLSLSRLICSLTSSNVHTQLRSEETHSRSKKDSSESEAVEGAVLLIWHPALALCGCRAFSEPLQWFWRCKDTENGMILILLKVNARPYEAIQTPIKVREQPLRCKWSTSRQSRMRCRCRRCLISTPIVCEAFWRWGNPAN